MPRASARSVGVGIWVIGLPCLLWVVSAQGESRTVGTNDNKPDGRANPLLTRLNAPVTLEKGIESTTLRDIMEFLGDRYGLTIVVNTEAFKASGFDTIEDNKVRLSKMVGVSLRTVLRLLLKPFQGTYRVRGGYVEVTTLAAASCDRAVPGSYPARMVSLPLVDAAFEARPLKEAVQELASLSDFSVVLDQRVGDKAKTALNASFTDVPLDTAVRLLADMADLNAVLLDNVLYITTKENAVRLQTDQEGPRLAPRQASKEEKGASVQENK